MANPTTADTEALELFALARVAALNGEGAALRRRAGLSIRDLSRICGVCPNSVVAWETGTSRPTGARALRYGQTLRELLAIDKALA